MSTKRRRISLVAILALAALSSYSAALAWACTPQSHIDLGATSGHPGGKLTVTGRAFLSGPVQIYWSGDTGPVLATATGPSFTVTITIPRVTPGLYYPHGVARDPNSGTIAGDAGRGFEVVTISPPHHAATGHPLPFKHARGDRTTPAAPHQPATTPKQAPLPQPAAVQQSAVPAHSVATPSSAASATPAVSSHRASPAVHRSAAPRGMLTIHGVAPVLRSAQPWKASPASASARGSRGPNLRIAIGVGMLALGLVALFAGFAMAEMRRRRAMALSTHHWASLTPPRGPVRFQPGTAKPRDELAEVLQQGDHTLSLGDRELIASWPLCSSTMEWRSSMLSSATPTRHRSPTRAAVSHESPDPSADEQPGREFVEHG